MFSAVICPMTTSSASTTPGHASPLSYFMSAPSMRQRFSVLVLNKTDTGSWCVHVTWTFAYSEPTGTESYRTQGEAQISGKLPGWILLTCSDNAEHTCTHS